MRREHYAALSKRELSALMVVGVADHSPATSAEGFDKHQNDRQMTPSDWLGKRSLSNLLGRIEAHCATQRHALYTLTSATDVLGDGRLCSLPR